MGRVILEVDDELARAWHRAPQKFREKLEKDIENQIQEKIRQSERENFIQLLSEVRDEAHRNGLTHDKLESFLNGD